MSSHENPSSDSKGYKFTSDVLDPDFYEISKEDKEFMEEYIGIKYDAELKEHALEMRRKAYEVVPYPCVQVFEFIRFRVRKFPEYPKILALPKEREDAIFLDLGTGMGQELRRLVYDGYPAKNIVATDLEPELWQCGYDLFKDSPDVFPVRFIPGDIFKTTDALGKSSPDKSDTTLTASLLPLKDRVSIMYAGRFFHVFSKDQQDELARRCVSLLVKEKGSIIFGEQIGALEPRNLRDALYIQSPDSWERVWKEAFGEISIKCRAELVTKTFDDSKAAAKIQEAMARWNVTQFLFWSVEII